MATTQQPNEQLYGGWDYTQQMPQNPPRPRGTSRTPTSGQPVQTVTQNVAHQTGNSTPPRGQTGTSNATVNQNPQHPTTTSQHRSTNDVSVRAAHSGGPDYGSLNINMRNWGGPQGLERIGYNPNDPRMQEFETAVSGFLSQGNIQGLRDYIGREGQGQRLNQGGLYHAGLYGQHVLSQVDALEAAHQESIQSQTGNPFKEGNVQETFGPGIQAITEQGMLEADQQLESEQQIREHTGELYSGIEDRTNAAGERIEGLQTQGRAGHALLNRQITELQGRLPQMAQEATQRFDQAMTDTMARVDNAQGLIDGQATHALGQVMQGQSAAMQAATQGIQAQTSAQIAQINANPNLSPAQKAQMSAQVRMQGTASMAPAVGQTIHQFNDLYSRTATSFGQMTAQIQQSGIGASAQIGSMAASAYAESTIAANQLSAGLLNLRQQSNSSYLASQANLESTRATIENSGDALRAALLPEMGQPHARYYDTMVNDLQMNFNMAQTEFQNMVGMHQMDLAAYSMQLGLNSAQNGMWQGIAQATSNRTLQTVGWLGTIAGAVGLQMPDIGGMIRGGGESSSPPPPTF